MSMFLEGSGLEVVGRVADAIELREDEIPDFDGLAAFGMVVDFAAGSADAVGALAGGAGGPEVFVFLAALDAIGCEPDVLLPDAGGFVVVDIDGDGETLGRNGEPLFVGEKFPAPVDGFALEVVAEAEVAEHLEERVVVGGAADVVDVAGAEALLAGGGAGEFELHFAEEVVLELVHAGGREEDGGIPGGDEHIAGAAVVALGFEECQVLFAELVGFHAGGVRVRGSGCWKERDPEYNRGVRVGAGRSGGSRGLVFCGKVERGPNCLQAANRAL